MGSTWNVLPKSGYFEGTIRSFNPSVQRDLKAHFISIIRHIAESLEVDVAFEWGVTPPVTFNDEELTQVVWEASQGLAEVIPAKSFYSWRRFRLLPKSEFPGVFAFIGSNGESDAPDLHHDHMTSMMQPLRYRFPIMLKMRKLYCGILKPKKCDKEKLSPP